MAAAPVIGSPLKSLSSSSVRTKRGHSQVDEAKLEKKQKPHVDDERVLKVGIESFKPLTVSAGGVSSSIAPVITKTHEIIHITVPFTSIEANEKKDQFYMLANWCQTTLNRDNNSHVKLVVFHVKGVGDNLAAVKESIIDYNDTVPIPALLRCMYQFGYRGNNQPVSDNYCNPTTLQVILHEGESGIYKIDTIAFRLLQCKPPSGDCNSIVYSNRAKLCTTCHIYCNKHIISELADGTGKQTPLVVCQRCDHPVHKKCTISWNDYCLLHEKDTKQVIEHRICANHTDSLVCKSCGYHFCVVDTAYCMNIHATRCFPTIDPSTTSI
jgi:hypothetical protein